ncbi:MAG: triose-phosphate isomerase [Proteobacteria bacterium]|nr:triose-phosphate isomerase [Pseudomonadota bacterium]MBU1139410.1 triose-phosphate isomerase [Pseudomonadota bacterium]MBU1232685.1 triose-phosphate isomerase [Pseudomonadota bacterium]MBU1418860.1 triose-phosphate isomerase [Pseudomonadota bacterium]MBU1455716.1 triose-phosphate isomerase [Pseudomonadota bacterium]
MTKYVVGNWKCNKGQEAAQEWFSEFAGLYSPIEGLEVIVAPSLICLLPLSQYVQALQLKNVSLAAQDVSPFPKGSYTGAVAADMLKGLVDYVIIGHSERRRYFHETSQDTANKMAEAVDAGLKPIVCIDQPYAMSQLTALNDIDCDEMIIAYGPVEATSARVPESPQRVAETAKFISQVHSKRPVIYGGSLFPDNVGDYVSLPQLSGLFVGESSLDPKSFVDICNRVGDSIKHETGNTP